MERNSYTINKAPTVHGDERATANVEAEKGETMVTKDQVSNQRKLVNIGGKKHPQGGTPLNVPEGTAIYSDTLKIKDPMLLKYFNTKGKKPKTFAELSKKYDITKLQEERADEGNDKVTNDSLDKSLEDANFKLSALFTLQEFHEKKGSPEEHSKHFEAFLDRTGITYEDMLGVTEEQPAIENPEMMSKYGSEVKFNQLPRADYGDVVKSPPYNESVAYTKEGIQRLNEYLKKYGISELALDAGRDAIKAKVSEAQRAAIKENPKLIFDFMTTDTDQTEKSHRPNDKLQGIMKGISGSAITPTGPNGTYSNEDLRNMLEEGTLTAENVADAYQDNKWWYRMVDSDIKTISKEEMAKKKALLEKEGITQGDTQYLYMGDGYYEAYRTKPDGSIEQIEADPAKIDKLHEWKIKQLDDSPQDEKSDDFLWANKRALSRSRQAKREIPYLKPFSVVPDTQYVDQAYYDPAQAINAMQSMSADATKKQAMFAPQQQQSANFMATQNADAVAKIIGAYEDKNVGAYNKEEMVNTQIANRASDRLARSIEGHHDKNNILKQSYANAISKANDNIANQEIAMWQERADRLNLEGSIGEQYAKDPDTGIITFQKGKDLDPTTGTQKTILDKFNEIKTQSPGITDEIAYKMASGEAAGKYNIARTEQPY
jgi:hypothetical protein